MSSIITKAQQILIDSISLTSDAVGVFDPQDRVIFANTAFDKLFGYAPGEALNQLFSDMVHHAFFGNTGINVETDDIAQWLQMADQKRRSKSFRTFETDTKSGRWFLITEQVIEDGYIYLHAIDITQKKKAEQELAKLTEKLHISASTDYLTNIYNRRHFYHLAEIELKRCQRNNIPYTLLMIDLDYFKRINDKFGHAAGDTILIEVTKAIKSVLRPYDIFARLGGEEFAIFLPETNNAKANKVTERVRSSVEKLVVNFEQHQIRTTTSIGVVHGCSSCVNLDDIVSAADNNLYLAKSNGRNIIWPEV